MNQANLDEDDEYLLDVVKGEKGKKRKMAILNRSKLTKNELDELFLGEDNEKKI